MYETQTEHGSRALDELSGYKQFVVWFYGDGKKLPINPESASFASSTNPKTWGTYEKLPSFYGNQKSIKGWDSYSPQMMIFVL
jgi:hypothetical protein